MQNSGHNNMEDKFAMNFGAFDTDSLFNSAHMGGLNLGMKRTAHEAGLDRENMGLSSDEDDHIKKEDRIIHPPSSSRENVIHHHQTAIEEQQQHHTQKTVLPNGKKTKGRVKIKMEFIDNKLRRYTTFSKRKTGIMKKAYELSTLTGTQVMLLVASETGHVYTFATRKLQPMITSEAGKALIQTCLNSPDPPQANTAAHQHDQRMSATGYEETELTYAVTEEEHKVRQMMYSTNTSASSSPSPFTTHAHHQTSNSSSSNGSNNSSLQPLASPLASSPSSHHTATAAAVSLALQSHHHHSSQYQHHPLSHPPSSPHMSSPNSIVHSLPPHHTLSSQPLMSPHSEHSGGLVGLHHHTSHIVPPPPQTPLPPQSPLPPILSPMGTPSPTSTYQIIHHHPHHHIVTHSR